MESHNIEKGRTGCTLTLSGWSGERHPSIRAFMDEPTMATSSVLVTRWILRGLQQLVTLALMSFNYSKSNGSEVTGAEKGASGGPVLPPGVIIPSITEQLVKSLRNNSDRLDPRSTNMTSCPGSCGLCWSIRSLLQLSMERKIGSYFLRWLGLPEPSARSSTALFGKSNILQL